MLLRTSAPQKLYPTTLASTADHERLLWTYISAEGLCSRSVDGVEWKGASIFSVMKSIFMAGQHSNASKEQYILFHGGVFASLNAPFLLL